MYNDIILPSLRRLKQFLWPLFLAAFLIFFIVGCAVYHPLPLEKNPHASRISRLVIMSKRINHPILKPVKIDLRDGISPDEAALLAVAGNPELRALRDQMGIVKAQLIQAGLIPNPSFSYDIEKPTGGRKEEAVKGFEFGVNFDLSSLVSKGARIEEAKSKLKSVEISIAWREWQVAEAAKLHTLRLFWIGKMLPLSIEEVSLLRKNLELTEKALRMGLKNCNDIEIARKEYQSAKLSLINLKNEYERERLALNRTIGIPPGKILSLQREINFPRWDSLPNSKQILRGIENRRLDLLALRIGYKSQEARLRAAVLSQFPGLSIRFARARDVENVLTSNFGISIELPFFKGKRGKIELEKATRKKLYDEYNFRVFEARSDVVRIIKDMKFLKSRIRTKKSYIKTQAHLVSVLKDALAKGESDIFSFYSARKELIEQRLFLLRLKERLSELALTLELVSGRYLPSRSAKASKRKTGG